MCREPNGDAIWTDVGLVERRDITRRKAADRITKRRHAREEIDRADISSAAMPADAPPAMLAALKSFMEGFWRVISGKVRRREIAHAGVSRPTSGSNSSSSGFLTSPWIGWPRVAMTS